MNLRTDALTLIAATLLLAGCGDRSPPAIEEFSVTASPNPSAPLAASALVQANEPVSVTFQVRAADDEWTIDPEAGFASEHRIPVLGLRAGTKHRVAAVVSDSAGNQTVSDTIEIRTDPLPDGFPRFEVRQAHPGQMEPGATLFNLFRWPKEGIDEEFGAVAAVDEGGNVIWYYRADTPIVEARLLPSGHLLYLAGNRRRAYEVDMLGNVVRQWHATGLPNENVPEGSIGVDVETFHHEFQKLPSGNLLTLSTEVRRYEDYPTSTVDPDAPTEPAGVIGDVIVEFTPDGRVVREVKLLDVLDPYRTGSGSSLSPGFWGDAYGDRVDGRLIDWAHTNAVFYDEDDRAFIISSRFQDAVVKIDASSEEIVWILGSHERWSEPWSKHLLTPRGDLTWPNHQHAPMVTPRETILMFDNGTFRGGPVAEEEQTPASEKYSRAVEYEVDEQAMEVRQVWSSGGLGEEQFYASFLSDADELPETGNVLIIAGAVVTDSAGVATTGEGGPRSARIMEVTHERPARTVFDLSVEGDEPEEGWHVYRAQRVPSLYGSTSGIRD